MSLSLPFQFTEPEWTAIRSLPVDDVIQLATHLDLAPPEDIDKRQVLERCIPRLVDRLQRDGIPLTKYDTEDIQALTEPQRRAMGRLLGLRGTPSARSILRSGVKVTRAYQKQVLNDTIPYMTPILLGPIIRLTLVRMGEATSGAKTV